jgi:lipopolysaccharide transport system permease protein
MATTVYSVWQHRRLVGSLARRELTDLHAGQLGGPLWVILHPLLLVLVYVFLFTAVLKLRIGGQGPADYLLYLLSGLAPWLLTQDAIVRSGGVLIASGSIVKKVMFPIEVLAAKTLTASLLAQSVLMLAVVVLVAVVRGALPWTFLLLPLLLAVHVALLLGLALLLSVITPYFRDVPELVRVFTAVNIFLIPVMYLPEWVPQGLRPIVDLNPFSHLVWCYQDVLYFGALQHPWSWPITIVLAGLSLLGGSAVFNRLKHYVGGVL